MKNVFNFEDFVNEELKKLPTTYNFSKSGEVEDKKHDRLAAKNKDDHKWKKNVSKHGTESKTEKFTCACGYKKTVVNDENKNVTITYSK
jgi:hypothetical protein